MAGQYPFLIGAAFGTQATRGTADPTIAALTGALAVANGLVLGDPESGVGETGISVELGRNFRDKAVVTGSFTRSFADLIGTTVESFSIAVPMKGNGATISGTPADSEFEPHVGILALLRALGLTSADWGSGIGRIFTPAASDIITAKLWFGAAPDTAPGKSVALVVKDIEAGSAALEFTPGEIGVMTFELGGTYESNAIEDTPTFNYGAMNTLSAPAIQSVGHSWGLSAALRGFTQLSIGIDNASEDVPDSNASGGSVPRQTDRTIDIEATVYAEDNTDLNYELDQLRETVIGNAQPLLFTVGSVAGAGAVATGYRVRIPTPELQSWAPDKAGNSQVATLSLRARGATANSEFELIWL